MYMIHFNKYMPSYNQLRPLPQQGIMPFNAPPNGHISFRLQGIRANRPKGMYIDMNAGKGCGTCGKGAV